MDTVSQILIDEKMILAEVEEYYANKEKDCLQTVEKGIGALDQRFSEDELPAATNTVLDAAGSYESTDNLKVPSPIHFGHLVPAMENNGHKVKAFIDFIESKGFCVEMNNNNVTEAHQFLQNTGLKILLSLDPAVINIVIIDPEGNGANFKLLLGYAKARPNLVLNKSEIGAKLSDILKTFNKLQTDNLTFKHDSLEDLNVKEPKLTKPYTFIFLSNFPAGFRKEDVEVLEGIIAKGNKYGTFLFMSYDPTIRPDWTREMEIGPIVNSMALLKQGERGYKIFNCKEAEVYNEHYDIELDKERPAAAEDIISFLNEVAEKGAKTSITQDEYFDKVLSGTIEPWKEYAGEYDNNTGIKVPVGLKSATQELEFTFDCGTDNYHAIIGGKTGSGKTVLLDNIIVNGAVRYSPKELQFVLLDFKGGSFQKYRDLPHLKISFGGQDRSYGLNVLRFLVDENARRQLILANYGGNINAVPGADRVRYNLPRYIIILDEFQVLLKEIDSITREANRHIDTIAQQGRSAGMHIILSSQDLTGITISDSAQINANLRIALVMDPIACKQIFSMDNTEASTLEKKGEAIYNDKAGRPKFANQRFVVYYLKEKIPLIVNLLNKKYTAASGIEIDKFLLPNEKSASVTDNKVLVQQLSEKRKPTLYPKVYIGEPTFIKVNTKTGKKEDSYIQFKRAENANLLIAGNDMDAAAKVLGLMLVQLLQQNQGATFYLNNNFGGDKIEWRAKFKSIESVFGDSFKYYQKSEGEAVLTLVENEINRRKTDEEACSVNSYLIILNLDASYQKQGYNVSEQAKKITTILKQGPDLGVHTIIYSYSAKSLANSGIETDLFESKILLRGDSKEIVKMGEQKELTKEKMLYLYAPLPVTSVNPDLVNIYSICDENTFEDCREEVKNLVGTLLKDIEDNE